MRYLIITLTALLLSAMQPALAFNKNEFVKDIEYTKALVAQGRQKEAIAYWEKFKPKYGGAQGHYENELGNLYSNAKMYDRAEKAYLDGVALKGKYPRLYIGLAFVYHDQNRFAEAEKWATRAIEEYPNWWLGYATLGQIEWRQNNFTSARTWLKKSLDIEPQALTLWLLAIVSYELKDPQTAIDSMEAAINLDRSYMGDEQGMTVVAVALAQVGRYKDAYAAIASLEKSNAKVKKSDLQAVISEIRKLEREGIKAK